MRFVSVPARVRARVCVLCLAWASVALWSSPGFGEAGGPPALGKVLSFEGACDASAVVELAPDQLLVGDDADNVLRLYSQGGGAVQGKIDVHALTEVGAFSKRNWSAIEGAARQGDRIYWIGSHARTRKKGKNRPNRRRLFSLRVSEVEGAETATPVGKSYSQLSAALETAPKLASLHLERAIMLMHREMVHLSPDKSGLNIEGLAAAKDGLGLLIGLRNPSHRGSAIILPLRNPQDLVTGSEQAYFDEPILLDLDRMGIASLEHSPTRGSYYILAGRKGEGLGYRLYSWSGETGTAPVLAQDLTATGLNAQAMAISRDGKRAIVLSDDGDAPIAVADWAACRRSLDAQGRCPCSSVKDESSKSFRGMWLKLP